MNFLFPQCLCWFGVFALAARGATAAITTTSSFTAIPEAVYVNGNGSSLLQPLTFGDLTIVPSFNFGSGTFSSYTPTGLPSDPGDGAGYLAAIRAPSPKGDLTLNFSMPVAAFGATFLHLNATTLRRWGVDLPAIIRAYDGPDGTGNLLGSVTSSGWFASALGYNFDFVGVMSTSLNIQSVVIGGAAEPKGFGVDAYAYSLTPVPEPSLLTIGLLGAAVGLRRRRQTRSRPPVL